MRLLRFSILMCGLASALPANAQTSWQQSFSSSTETAYESWKPETTAKVDSSAIHLLTGKEKESNGILFAATVKRSAWVETSFEMRIGGADGAGLVFWMQLNPTKVKITSASVNGTSQTSPVP